MASTSSLLGLVTQLQNLEHSITSILMEMAIRLSSLTDTKIFLLIETQEGRKFVGKRHLCDDYIRGNLGPIGNDVEYNIDNSVTALRPRPFFDHDGVEKRSGSDASFSSLEGTVLGVEPVQRITGSYPGPPSYSKTKRLKFDNTLLKSQTFATVPPVKIENGLSDPDTAVLLPDGDGRDHPKKITKRACASKNQRHRTSLTSHRFASSFLQSPLPSFDVEEIISTVNSKLSAEKLETMRNISGEIACTRGTSENRLSTSACYEFGKMLAEYRPLDLEAVHYRKFFNVSFEQWVSQFANLSDFFSTSIPNGRPEGGQTFTFLGLLRQCARAAYFQRINKKTNRTSQSQ